MDQTAKDRPVLRDMELKISKKHDRQIKAEIDITPFVVPMPPGREEHACTRK